MMTKRTLTAIVLFGIISGWLVQPLLARKGNGGGSPAPVLTEAEALDLLFMREEEKLAHDVYTTLYDKWGNKIFSTISDSEQRHTDAVLALLNKYGLKDPAREFGEFADSELQNLYNTKVADGLKGELESLMVGALIEEVDIEDIVAAMGRTDKVKILNVYGNLLAGSENHLRAFVKNIEAITGQPYVAQWISQDAVDTIRGR